jgi:hypothetical protein
MKMKGSQAVTELPKINGATLQKFTSKQKLQQASIAFLIHQMSTNEKVKNLRAIFKQLDESGDGKTVTERIEEWISKVFL